jgi:hypothetical protein
MSVSWLVNWKSIFPNKNVKNAKIRCKLISDSTNNINNTWNGSCRLSIQSDTCKITDGLNIGNTFVKKDPIQVGYYYLECNTLETDGFSVIIPSEEQSLLRISFYDCLENTLTTIPHFQAFFYFDTV